MRRKSVIPCNRHNADDTGNGDSSALCAVARIRHMEQGACCCAYNILPDNHIGTRRLKSAKRENEELLRTMGMSGTAIFFKLKFPAALPSFFSAIKMAIPLSILGAAMGEWLGAQSGLGYFSKRMMTQLDGAGVFAPVVVLAVCAMLVVAVISAIERKLITWRKEI